jgi:hypothetical protein
VDMTEVSRTWTPAGGTPAAPVSPFDSEAYPGAEKVVLIGPHGSPWTDSRFWILQLVVLAIALVRLAATVAFHLDTESLVLEFSTFALFLVPVIFAALNYGLMGALVTSGWVSLLALPRRGRQPQSGWSMGRTDPGHSAGRACIPRRAEGLG